MPPLPSLPLTRMEQRSLWLQMQRRANWPLHHRSMEEQGDWQGREKWATGHYFNSSKYTIDDNLQFHQLVRNVITCGIQHECFVQTESTTSSPADTTPESTTGTVESTSSSSDSTVESTTGASEKTSPSSDSTAESTTGASEGDRCCCFRKDSRKNWLLQDHPPLLPQTQLGSHPLRHRKDPQRWRHQNPRTRPHLSTVRDWYRRHSLRHIWKEPRREKVRISDCISPPNAQIYYYCFLVANWHTWNISGMEMFQHRQQPFPLRLISQRVNITRREELSSDKRDREEVKELEHRKMRLENSTHDQTSSEWVKIAWKSHLTLENRDWIFSHCEIFATLSFCSILEWETCYVSSAHQ